MKSKKQRAIEILERHRDAYSSDGTYISIWGAMLMDLIAKYVGKDSMLYSRAKNFYNYPSSVDSPAIHSLINSTIEYIRANGVVKEDSVWRRLEATNQRVVYAAFIGIAGFLIFVGAQLNQWTSMNKELQIRIENQKLKEKLQSFPVDTSLNVTNKITDPDKAGNN